MRLINTSTLKMEEFVGDANHVYAILSHTWGEKEVSFHQYSTPTARLMAGYHKIEHSCALALRSGFRYLWIDTCCIDKSSSAELSEAINSMYRWYQDAAVCYVYLSDMKRCEVDQKKSKDGIDPSKNFQMLQGCRWFTRGWTLQELLAPQDVEFYDQDWVWIGTKRTMWALLSRITGINSEHLWNFQGASVAQKMSWAANRQTTRTEDKAYSLLGLFNVNMPLLYGEGQKAFRRLQHEILQSTNDESIFAWTDDRLWTSGLLAESPLNFAKSGDVVPINRFYRKPYTMTNQGFQIELRLPNSENKKAGRFETPLHCTKESMWGHVVISLYMTYYTDDIGALRALRSGPFQVGMMKMRDHRYDTDRVEEFHIDDFRRPKLLPHQETPLYTIRPTEVSRLDLLTLRLSGELRAEDICISENTGPRRLNGSFCVVDRNKAFLAAQSNQTIPIIYVYWSYDYDPAYLTFRLRPFDPSRFGSTQELLSANKRPLSDFKLQAGNSLANWFTGDKILLQAGNSLATWFSGDKILFIALSILRPREACIDIQLDTIPRGTEGLLQLSKADPLRGHTGYPKITAFAQTELPSKKTSGQLMYGVPISGLGHVNL